MGLIADYIGINKMSKVLNLDQSYIQNISQLWVNKQFPVAYGQSRYVKIQGILAQSTSINLPTYSSGRILSSIDSTSNVNLQDLFINYDPNSSDPNQIKPSHILASEWVNNLVGTDVTNSDTVTNTYQPVDLLPLIPGIMFYELPLILNNESGVLVSFENYYNLVVVSKSIKWNGIATRLLAISSVISGGGGGGINTITSSDNTIIPTPSGSNVDLKLAQQGATNNQMLVYDAVTANKYIPKLLSQLAQAGTGITITQNADGTILINATGTGGLSAVNIANSNGFTSTNSTVNGVETITLAVALGTSASPVLLYNDGTSLRAVTIGNNLTFSGGTLSASGGASGITTITSPDGTVAITINGNTASINVAQQGATTGQVYTYNGTKWVPANLPTFNGVTDVTSSDNSVTVTTPSGTTARDLSIVGKAVRGITTNGANPLTDIVDIIGTGNTNVTRSGNQIIINSTGGGGGATASFSANPSSGTAPLTVQFTDTSNPTPTAWNWTVTGTNVTSADYSFTNSTTATSQNPQITFNSVKTFVITLTPTKTGVTYTAMSVSITPTPAPVVNGDFTMQTVISIGPNVSVVKRSYWDYVPDDLIDLIFGLVNTQTCASVTSATITSNTSSLAPTIPNPITPANINSGATVNSMTIPRPTVPSTTYTATVVAVMNNSNGTTASKTQTGSVRYYLPALYLQNQSTTPPTLTSGNTQLGTDDFALGQSGNISAGNDIQVLWLFVPNTTISPDPVLWIGEGGLWAPVAQGSKTNATVGNVNGTLYGYQLSATGRGVVATQFYVGVHP